MRSGVTRPRPYRDAQRWRAEKRCSPEGGDCKPRTNVKPAAARSALAIRDRYREVCMCVQGAGTEDLALAVTGALKP